MELIDNRKLIYVDAFVQMLREIGIWAAATFPGESMDEKLTHLCEEIEEARADPANVEEWADAVILVFDAARAAGHTPDQIVLGVRRKFFKNQNRTWERRDDGVYRHVKNDQD